MTAITLIVSVHFPYIFPAAQENIGADNNANVSASIIVPTILGSLLVLALLVIACLVICVCKKRKRPHTESNPVLVNNTAQLLLDNPIYDGKLSPAPLDNPTYDGKMSNPAPNEENVQLHNPMYRIMEGNSAVSAGDSKDVDGTRSDDLSNLPDYPTLQSIAKY